MQQEITLTVTGQPPYRDTSLPFYSPDQPQYYRVARLRETAAKALDDHPDWNPRETRWIALALTMVQPDPSITAAAGVDAVAGVAAALQVVPLGIGFPGASLYVDMEQIRVVRFAIQVGDTPAYRVLVRLLETD